MFNNWMKDVRLKRRQSSNGQKGRKLAECCTVPGACRKEMARSGSKGRGFNEGLWIEVWAAPRGTPGC